MKTTVDGGERVVVSEYTTMQSGKTSVLVYRSDVDAPIEILLHGAFPYWEAMAKMKEAVRQGAQEEPVRRSYVVEYTHGAHRYVEAECALEAVATARGLDADAIRAGEPVAIGRSIAVRELT